MYDKATWTSSRATFPEIDIQVPDDFPRQAAGGWWILPSAIVGSMGWFAIISLVF